MRQACVNYWLDISCLFRCICPDPEERPDIVQVASHISEQILIHMDSEQRHTASLQRSLEKERRRTRKYYSEINSHRNKYNKMLIVTQDRYDKLVNLQSSGGAGGIKTGMVAGGDGGAGGLVSAELLSDDSASSTGGVRSAGSGWSDEDSTSSGSDSRENSAGRRRYRNALSQQLNVEIGQFLFVIFVHYNGVWTLRPNQTFNLSIRSHSFNHNHCYHLVQGVLCKRANPKASGHSYNYCIPFLNTSRNT